MAKYYGAIGYNESIEKRPGVWVEEVIPHNYSGDLIRDTRRLQNSGQVNDSITVSNIVSIVADPYAEENYYNIRYAVLRGVKWKVTNVEVIYPRLLLTLGGLYVDTADEDTGA